MTMTIADNKIQAAAENARRIGVRKLQDEHWAGYPLVAEEVFAVLFQPELQEVAQRLESKYGTALFNEARDGRSKALGELLAADRDELRAAALTVAI